MAETTSPALAEGKPPLAGLTGRMVLLGALSLGIGWGIRGNFGHEYGAMIAGTLAAMAVVLVSGREDWHRRIAFFAFFGALGWSFGGTISYMQVIAYTHSGHLPSQVYGFANLFVIGFVWAAMGGLGTAVPACLDRERLTELVPPIIAVFLAWFLQDVAMWWNLTDQGDFRHEDRLYWHDTDWVAALLAIEAVLVYAAVRGRFGMGTRLVLYASIGWWAGFLGLVEVLGLRMTPPRGDNWAAMVGMTAGLFVFCIRYRLWPILLAGLIAGFIGGLGFPTAQAIKLLWIKTGLQTNWHSVLEQTYGAFNGIGIAVAMGVLASRIGLLREAPASVTEEGASLHDRASEDEAGSALGGFTRFILGVLTLIGVLLIIVGATAALLGLAGMCYHVGLHRHIREGVMGLNPQVDLLLGDPTWKKFVFWMNGHFAGLFFLTFGRVLARVGRLAQEGDAVSSARVPARRWTEAFCVGLVMIGLTYVNLVKNVETWIKHEAMPAEMYGLHAYWWFTIGYVAVLIAFVVLAVRHHRRPLGVIPDRWVGRAQLLYLTFLWVMVIGNLMRAIPPFHPQRLITEGVIIINAIVCTVLVLILGETLRCGPAAPARGYGRLLGKTLLVGVFSFIALLGAQTAIARLCYGDEHAPGAGKHIRFGPDATTSPAPKEGQAHP